MSDIDISEIVPEGIDAETIHDRVQTYSAGDEQQRCPECGYANLSIRNSSETRFRCKECEYQFDEAVYTDSIDAAKRRGEAR